MSVQRVCVCEQGWWTAGLCQHIAYSHIAAVQVCYSFSVSANVLHSHLAYTSPQKKFITVSFLQFAPFLPLLTIFSFSGQTSLMLFKTVQMTAEICIHKIPRISFKQISALSYCAFIMRLYEICICSFLTSYQAIWPFTAIHNNNLISHTSTITARGEERTALSSKRRYPSLLLSAADIVARMIFFS